MPLYEYFIVFISMIYDYHQLRAEQQTNNIKFNSFSENMFS